MELPSVLSYLDYRAFLKDWLEAKKRANPTYSFATFARAGGCSKAALANVLGSARSPRGETLDAFARAMDLRPSERNYLGLLVELEASTTADRRREILETILASEHYQQVKVAEHHAEADMFRYVEHWYIPVIRELAGLRDFQPDPVWIASIIRPPIRVDQAQEALETLLDLGFLTRRPDGSVVQAELRFRTAADATQRAITHYQRESIPNLLRSLDVAEAPNQHVLAAVVALDAATVAEAKLQLNALLESIANMADAIDPKELEEKETRRVYQVAFQLIPVSHEPR